MIQIVIGGDICPMGRIQKAFIDGNAEEIFHDLLAEIASADLSVANLECPLISKESPIIKPGGALLGANISSINGFIASKWHVLNLANNHSFDHGANGLHETIRTIKEAGIDCVGAGPNIEEANKPFIQEINDIRLVIYSMAEREYSVANKQAAGANPLDLINFVNAVRQYKKQGLFIVLIHGGQEFYPYPSPEMIRRCRFMVDMGADAVICCHTHCPLPWEIYAERPIIYGLGNMIFEPFWEAQPSWHEGYLAKLTIDDMHIHFEAIPYFQYKAVTGAQKMNNAAKNSFFDDMRKKGAQIKDDVFIANQWTKYCQQRKDTYLSMLFGYNKTMRKLRRLLLPLLHSQEERHRALLIVQCETHREILNTIFKNARKEV